MRNREVAEKDCSITPSAPLTAGMDSFEQVISWSSQSQGQILWNKDEFLLDLWDDSCRRKQDGESSRNVDDDAIVSIKNNPSQAGSELSEELEARKKMAEIEAALKREHDEKYKPDLTRFPKKAIHYDNSVQPVEINETMRNFYPELGYVMPPFRRPIIIDGIGFIFACEKCKGNQLYKFPFDAILRCLFYWISRGHPTTLTFPLYSNPIDEPRFGASPENKKALRELASHNMLVFYKPAKGQTNRDWFKAQLELHKACAVTTIQHWNAKMPLLHESDQADGNFEISRNRQHIPVLQPFISHNGLLVFFSSLSSSGQPVEEMVTLRHVENWEDYNAQDKLQLSFIEQAIQLKKLHEELPSDMRFRETAVMVEVLKRLEPFLAGGALWRRP